MFGLYDTVGVNFRGTADDLYKLKALNSSHQVENDVSQNKPTFEQLTKNVNLYQGEITNEAKEAYRKMTKLNNKSQIFHIRDLMSKVVFTVDESQTIADALNIMKEKNIEQLPVTNEKGILTNLFTKDMILELLSEDPEYADENLQRKLSSFFTTGVITTDPITDIRRAAKVMVDYKLNALPVVNQNHNLVGIVSRSDILKAVANTPDFQIWA